MPIHPTFSFVSCSGPKTIMHPQIITDPPPCLTVWWTCWGPTRSSSPIQLHDLPFELHLFIFVLSLEITHFQLSMVQFSYLWANYRACQNMFTIEKWFLLLHLCTQSSLSQSTPYSDVKQEFTCLKSKSSCCHICNSKSTFSNKSDTMPLLLVYKKLWMPSSLSLNLAPYIIPQMHYRRLAHAHYNNNFASRKTTSKLHQNLVLMFLRQWSHTATNDSTNCTSCTLEPRLHNAQEILWRSQLHNAHRDVDVGKVVANKSNYCNPVYFDIS